MRSSTAIVLFLFASLFMPGLGQLLNKDYLKGTMLLGGFAYCLIKNTTLRESESSGQLRRFYSSFDGFNYRYFIDGIEYNYRTWKQILDEQENRGKNNEKIRKEKKKLKVYLGTIYILNILDALLTSKKFNNKKTIERKLSLEIGSINSKPQICLRYRY